MSQYSYKFEDERYVIYENSSPLTTPSGNIVTTLYEPLADRILLDLNRYGMNFRSASSILSWHFTMIDNFAEMGRKRVIETMIDSFLTHIDWTCLENHGKPWFKRFGDWYNRRVSIAQWLSEITLMQLTAACCIGNAYESLNISLTLALIVENYTGGERDNHLREVAHLIADTYQFGDFEEIYYDFKTFEMYYGFHFEEDGATLNGIIDICEDSDEELDIDDLTGHSVTIEQLIGRNFVHYINFEPDENLSTSVSVDALKLDISTEDEYIESDDENEDEFGEDDCDENDYLGDYLPDDCWVKRYVDDEDPDICYLMYMVVNDDGSIEDSGCIEETTSRFGGGGLFFMIPQLSYSSSITYDYTSYPCDKVLDDLHLLFSGKFISNNFTFIGKKLPQSMIDAGGNGGSNTNYTFALQSAYRLAYMHMSIDTDEQGIINQMHYSTYQSSGNAYGDMFSRPVSLSDRADEAMDMLLHIYDMYADDELDSESTTEDTNINNILQYKNKWFPILEEIKEKLDIDTKWIESPGLASDIAVSLLFDKTLKREDIIKNAFDETLNLSNSDNVEDIYTVCQRMANLCISLDYAPAGLWFGSFCEEILEKYEDAQYWYNKAASFGNGIAMYKVGMLYLNKKVALPETTSLKRCFTDAVAHGVAEAQIILDTYF